MPVQIESCRHIDYSPLVPDNPQPPLCKLGHGWSKDCLTINDCLDYEPATALTLEEFKAKYMA